MASISLKNMGINSAASDLGLGDQLQNQAEDSADELRKKKLKAMQDAALGGPMTMGGAAQQLFG